MTEHKLHCIKCNQLTNMLIKIKEKRMSLSCSDCHYVYSNFSTDLIDRIDTLEYDLVQVEKSLISHKNLFGSIMDQFTHISKDLKSMDERLNTQEVTWLQKLKNRLFKKK